MKTRMTIANSDFVNQLAGYVTQKDIPIIAEGPKDVKDTAKQTAISYWMMGWNWDEIETILEDSEYPKGAITYALDQAKQYASDMLQDGPFSVYKSGQLIKLTNGMVGKLVATHNDSLVVDVGDDRLVVKAEQVNIEASKILSQAFALRETANRILKTAQGGGDEITKELKPLSKPPKMPSTISEPEKEFSMDIRKNTPERMKEQIPQALETSDLSGVAAYAVSTAEALEQNIEELKTENAEIRKWLSENSNKIKEKQTEQQHLMQEAFAYITTQDQLLNTMTFQIVKKLQSRFVLIERIVESQTFVPTEQDTFAAVMEFFSTNFPEIMEQCQNEIEKWKQENTVIREKVREQVTTFNVSQEKAKTKKPIKSAGILDTLQAWMSNSWKAIKDFAVSFTNDVLPEVDLGVDILDEFIGAQKKQEIKASVYKAVKYYAAKHSR